MFPFLKLLFLIGIFVSYLLSRIYAYYITPVRSGMSFVTVTIFKTTYQFLLQTTNPCLHNLICLLDLHSGLH